MLDSDICIYLTSGRYPGLDRRVAEAGQLSISSIVLAELCYGVEKSERIGRNKKALDLLLMQIKIAAFDEEAARHYGQIRAHLERVGTPCGGNDMLIAGHARSLGLTLVTNNRREFDRMPGLSVENWA